MDLLRSYFFQNEPLISCPFLSSKLDSPVIKILERHSLNVKSVSPMFFLLQENLILLHFVAFFHVASLFSIGVDNKKVGVDNEKALELTNSTVFHKGRQ